jgi:uncharacterized damage-inducible protein DinB
MSQSLSGMIRLMRYQKSLTERAIDQISEQELREVIPGFEHSIAVLMKHIGGNLHSLWTNFRTEDGEKPWRNREEEFRDTFAGRKELMEHWERGWKTFFDSIESVQEEELSSIVYIRNEGHTIAEAAMRTLSHISYHTGQIVMMARYHAGGKWESLSIPKGKTEEYNRKKFSAEKSIGFYKDRLD